MLNIWLQSCSINWTYCVTYQSIQVTWWRHQMETFSALLAIFAGNSPVPGEFPTQWPVTRSFDVYFDLRPNKRLSKQSSGWWVEMLSHPSRCYWRHRNEIENAYTSRYGYGTFRGKSAWSYFGVCDVLYQLSLPTPKQPTTFTIMD